MTTISTRKKITNNNDKTRGNQIHVRALDRDLALHAEVRAQILAKPSNGKPKEQMKIQNATRETTGEEMTITTVREGMAVRTIAIGGLIVTEIESETASTRTTPQK